MAIGEILVWVDCEMTGLDLELDELIEIAVVITDNELNLVDSGFEVIVKPGQSALEGMGDFVRNMHEKSGLLEDLPRGITLAQAHTQLCEYLEKHLPGELTAPLAGNSVGTDRAFLMKAFPDLEKWLHYRTVDVSTIKELAKRWYPRVYFNSPEKDGNHRAMGDILDSIRELQYYRKSMFPEADAHSTTELRKISVEVSAEFSAKLV